MNNKTQFIINNLIFISNFFTFIKKFCKNIMGKEYKTIEEKLSNDKYQHFTEYLNDLKLFEQYLKAEYKLSNLSNNYFLQF